MAETYLVEPDINFINEIAGLGGNDLKKCFQCATCSVACTISPDNKPFPRKEMIAASWGLKDRLVGNPDVWLCHNCGDCSTQCPRGAKPGDVLAAVRSYAIADYAAPKAIGKAINDPKKLPLLLLVPVVIFLVLGLLTGLLDFSPAGEKLAHTNFFSTWLVDIIFIPLSIWVVVIFAMGLKRFVVDIHSNALLEGKTDKKELNFGEFIPALIKTIPTILKHSTFDKCGENKDRSLAHLLVFYSFIALFIVTGIFFVALYILQIHGPYSQLNPVKWLGNIAAVALILGGILMLKNRLSKADQVNRYADWYLVGLVLGLGISGLLTEVTRLAGWAGITYGIYFVHLVFVFNLFAFLPFSKLAHMVYRTVALAYNEYSGRQ